MSAAPAFAGQIGEIARAAGEAIMAIYRSDFSVQTKADASPLTAADLAAQQVILDGLSRLEPLLPIVSEEAKALSWSQRQHWSRYWLVDPLDGTREFLKGNGEFTVNVALVRDGAPVAGAVYAPAQDLLWVGGERAWTCSVPLGGAVLMQRRPLQTRPAPERLTALASRSHRDAETEAFLLRLPIEELTSAGSSLKFCVLAEGKADVYPRFGPTMEWDTAAGDAVLRAAGGTVLGADGAPFTYGKIGSGLKNGAFVAWGDRAAARRYG